jgi:surface carbohydrate biosynthesis protein
MNAHVGWSQGMQSKSPENGRGVEPVVILVDNKNRDLPGASLIAHHLNTMGVACYLEPLEAFRAVVATYRPGMIVFNHMVASHLADWSRRLADLGILVAVLPNEGIIYPDESRAFLSGKYHQDSHIDHFFCWNDLHGDAIRAAGFAKHTKIATVGIPRFDFYFKPWSQTLPPAPPRLSTRPRVLICTNFIFARLAGTDIPDKLFGGKQQTVPLARTYPGAVASHFRSRQRVLDYVRALLEDGRTEVLLRPHPMEDSQFYVTWAEGLEERLRDGLSLDFSTNIASLILDCDLQISCETCTTAVESWIARKPTIELIFDKHPMLYFETPAAANCPCDKPELLPDMVWSGLAKPVQPEKQPARDKHLATWCSTPDGQSARKVATLIAEALAEKSPADWSKLEMNDYRRAAKLRAYRLLGEAYHFDPLLKVKRAVLGQKYLAKTLTYDKSIRPRDVEMAKSRLNALHT